MFAACRRRRPYSRRQAIFEAYTNFFLRFITLGIVVLFGMLFWAVFLPTRQLKIYYSILGISLIPVAIAGYTIFRPHKSLQQRITPSVFVATIISGILPSWISAGLGAFVLFLFGWITRPIDSPVAARTTKVEETSKNKLLKSKSSDDEDIMQRNRQTSEEGLLINENSSKATNTIKFGGTIAHQDQVNLLKAAGCGIFLTAVMLTENFFIWVVSATFEQGWNPRTAPDPLTDNGRRILTHILTDSLELTKRQVVSYRRIWNVQYGLVAALGTGLCMADFHPTRQVWSLACRAILTMASARFLRTISFLLTVLPSQNKYCYGQHFPNPPPDSWGEWIMVGLQPNSHGGCNDLIISGHATVTSTIACVAVSLADDPIFSIAIWWLLAMDYAVEIYEGFHYSVDMWMGAVLCGLLWRLWKPIEDDNTRRNNTTLQDMFDRLRTDRITVKDAVKYGIPPLIAFLQVTTFPEGWTNFIIVGLISWGASRIVVFGLHHYSNQQYVKHIFYSCLCLALGVYL